MWATLLQCQLTGKAQEPCFSLPIEESLVYDKVKNAVLRVYELVPEAFRQRFQDWKKKTDQTYSDFAREKEVLFDRWCCACQMRDFRSVQELMRLEEFKNCIPERVVVYLNKQKVTPLHQAATLADEFELTHKVFTNIEPPTGYSHRHPVTQKLPCPTRICQR